MPNAGSYPTTMPEIATPRTNVRQLRRSPAPAMHRYRIRAINAAQQEKYRARSGAPPLIAAWGVVLT